MLVLLIMGLAENKNRSVEQIRIFLENDPEIQQAILFGSYATDTYTKRSDMDLAIQLRGPMKKEKKLSYLAKLQDCIDVELDLVDLHQVGQPLLSQILKYGQRLKGSSVLYAELAVKNVNTAQDFLPYIKRMLRERRERLLSG